MSNHERFWQSEISDGLSSERIQSAREKDGVEQYDAVFNPETIEWGDGKQMDFLGVAHVPETLTLHRKAIGDKIEASERVLLENAFLAKGILSERGVQEMMDIAQSAGVHVETGRLLEIFFHTPSVKFYRDVEMMVQEAGKKLVVADPLAGSSFSALEARDKDREYALLKKRLLNIAFFAAGVSAGTVLVSALGILDKVNASQHISRRDFLKALGGGAAFAGAALSARVLFRSGEIGYDSLGSRTQSGAEIFSLRDYRDVVVASAADAVLSERKQDGRLTTIYGSLHLSPVKHYLKHPEERMIRMAAYGKYRETVPPVADVYVPDPDTENGWCKKESISLYE